MDAKRMTVREKLAMMDEMKERNERRREEFLNMTEEQKARESRLLDMYLDGIITKEELYSKIKEGKKD